MSLFGASPLRPVDPHGPEKLRPSEKRRVARLPPGTGGAARRDDIVEVETTQTEDAARDVARNTDENATEDQQEHGQAADKLARQASHKRIDIEG